MKGKAPEPLEHYYGRLSQEFGGALPTAIIQEQRRLPVGFLDQVLEYRRYVEAYFANEANADGWESSPMRTLAIRIDMALAQEEIDEHTNG